jgi:signal transduction histidine kinase
VSLRTRLTLTVLAMLTATVAAVVAVTDVAFAAQQRAELGELLRRELARVDAVVRSGQLGAALLEDAEGTLVLQFVSRGGAVQLPDPAADPLPLLAEPEDVTDAAGLVGPWLVASVPWRLPSGVEAGTIRGAVSLAGLAEARADLRRTLISIAAIALVGAALVAVTLLRRGLAPLARLADDAERIDPSEPRLARYRGPDDEVGRVATTLNAALDAVRERREAERERLADVAHELAAPLTVVTAHLGELARRYADAAGAADRERLRAAETAASDLLHVSQDLLTLARGDLDERMRWEIVDLAKLAEETRAAHPGLSVVLAEREADLRTVADAARLRQVLRNLIRNAVRACGSIEGVELRLAPVGDAATPDAVRVRVEDDGPGLREEQRDAVFDRYRTGAGGTGLGLAVVRRLVERMGGEVRAADATPGGAAFEVEFPSLAASVEEDGADASSDAADGERGPAGVGPRRARRDAGSA